MSQIVLPSELHQLIIDVIGDEVVQADPSHSARRTLGACSLVCKAWHNVTLRHTFHNAIFSLLDGDNALERNTELFQLLEVNPSIGRCIRHAQMYLERLILPDDVEKLCHAISPVETFRLVLQNYPPDLPWPSLDGLHSILSSQHLRNLTIASPHLPLRLLEDVPNLRSLTLERVDMVDIEHGRDGAWGASTLEKLVVASASRTFLGQIQAMGDKNVGLFSFFDRLKYLDMDLNTKDLIPNGSWLVLLARWKCLETLVVHWSVSDSVEFLELCQKLPWESFQALRSLTYDIFYRALPPTQLFNAETDPSALIFTGPSILPNLEDLHVTYYNSNILDETEGNLDMYFDAIYRHNLNRTIEDPSSFPCLKTFHTELSCGGSGKLNNEMIVQHVVDRLPAIFGVGGRKETRGWVASVISTVPFDAWFD